MSQTKGNYILHYVKDGKSNHQVYLGHDNESIKQEAERVSKLLGNIRVNIFKLLGSQQGNNYISQPRM